MNLVLNARGVNSFVVPVTAQIDSITIQNGSPGQFVTLLFIQDGTGHTVSAGSGNIQGFATVSSTAFAVTAESFTFNSQGNTWVNISPSSAGAVSSVFGRTGAVVAVSGDYTVGLVTGAAPLASPTFTGVPAAPTAAPGTSTTQLATTAFVAAAIAAAATFVNQETVTIAAGTSSGTLAQTPNGIFFQFTRNGTLQNAGVDFTRIGTAITLTVPAENGDQFLAWYTK